MEAAFSSRLNEAMDKKQMKQVDVLRAAEEKGYKIGKSQLSQYVSGKTVPREETMRELADLLGVEAE